MQTPGHENLFGSALIRATVHSALQASATCGLRHSKRDAAAFAKGRVQVAGSTCTLQLAMPSSRCPF